MKEEFEFDAFDEQPFFFETEEEAEIPRGRMPSRGPAPRRPTMAPRRPPGARRPTSRPGDIARPIPGRRPPLRPTSRPPVTGRRRLLRPRPRVGGPPRYAAGYVIQPPVWPDFLAMPQAEPSLIPPGDRPDSAPDGTSVPFGISG